MLRTAAAAALVLAGLFACAEAPPARQEAAPSGTASDTSAASPMTVNPVTPGAPPGGGQSMPSTPPVLSEDPAQQPDDKSMPPGPVNPGNPGA